MRTSLVIAVLLLAAAPLATAADIPRNLDLEGVRALVVQHDGRWPPLDTLARDLVHEVTGTEYFAGADPVAVLLAWTFDPDTWRKEPLIRIANAELRRELELPAARKVFSVEELLNHPPLRIEMSKLASIGDRKMNPLESKVNDIQGKLGQAEEIFRGESIRLLPDPQDPQGAWQPVGSGAGSRSGSGAAVIGAWRELREAFLAGNAEGFSAASTKLAGALAALPAAYRPAPERIAVELRYNATRPFRLGWRLMALGAVLAAGALFVRRTWFDFVAVLGMLAGFVVLTFGLSERWKIAGTIPATNMFESLLFLSWGMGAFAIVSLLFVRHRLVTLTAAGMGALALFLADMLPLDHFVRPIAPVLLDTYWMSIHVPIIMVSYSVLALAVLVAHILLVVKAVVPTAARLSEKLDSMHVWYVHVGSILLLIGIVTGSMWAASSWGRYWGWDPKEVWSLVALLGYLTILHVRVDKEKVPSWIYGVGAILAVAVFWIVIPNLAPLTPLKIAALAASAVAMVFFVTVRGMVATAMKSVVAFWLVIMTYVGVNFILGIGLHSYGFGTGAVARYMLLLGTVDLAFVVACGLVYLVRCGVAPTPVRRPATGSA